MIRLVAALMLVLTRVAGAEDGVSYVTVQADSPQVLQARLIWLAQERLQPSGLLLDGSRARMSLSGKLPADVNLFEVRTAWPADVKVPPLPLTFTIRAGSAPWIHATLAVPVQQQVWVANRNLPKGSSVGCADLTLEYRNLREVPGQALGAPCDIPPGDVVLRYVGRRDILRSLDVGSPPVVAAGMPIAVTALVGGISVTTTAVALTDAMVGDRIDVRLTAPARTRHVRVTGVGTAKLEGLE